MTLKGMFQADSSGQTILGEVNSQQENVHTVVNVDTGIVIVSGQQMFHEQRTGQSVGNTFIQPVSPLKLHKGQSAVFYAYYLNVVGEKDPNSKDGPAYGAGTFEIEKLGVK
ncbi:hypothetical protein ACQR16_35220 [Bradyrhizobium oligotrophicum]|uniref:hypothetical protein n=1 Tax=Bradyrhizobium oligotrophicum TaxID=44255 RepID=UPI003EBE267F